MNQAIESLNYAKNNKMLLEIKKTVNFNMGVTVMPTNRILSGANGKYDQPVFLMTFKEARGSQEVMIKKNKQDHHYYIFTDPTHPIFLRLS